MAPNLNPTEVKHGSIAPELPVIDLSEFDGTQHDKVVESLVKAARTCGFFQVVNHGLTLQFLDELKDLVHHFFNQPAEDKVVYQKEFNGPEKAPLVNYFQSPPPETAQILLMRYTNEDEALQHWPNSCKEMTLKYRNLSSKLAESIVQALLGHLGVTLDESMVDSYMGESVVSMNYYATWPNPELKLVGAQKHTDSSLLTILLQDHVGGLVIKLTDDGDMKNNFKGEWVEVTPIPGALIVLVGDCLQVLSNGKYKSAEHCVPKTDRETRVSIPVFINPKSTMKIRPLPQVVEKDGGRPRYKEFLFAEYEFEKYSGQSLTMT